MHGLSCLRTGAIAIKALAAFGAHVRILRRIVLCLQGRRITVNASRALLTGGGSRELNLRSLFLGKELCSRNHLYRIGGSEENRTLSPACKASVLLLNRRDTAL